MKVKAIDEDKVRRLDNKFKNVEVHKLNTLKDYEIFDRTPIMVELKEDDEQEAEEQE